MTSTFSTTSIRCAGDSHPGMVRSHNEDRIHLDAERGIFIVIDGVGGQAAGDKAAEIALSRVRSRLERQTGSAAERVTEAITVANNEILRAARANPEWRGMACVLTVVVLEDGAAVVGHVGDSRLYQIRAGRITKITQDHSPVGEREDSQDISEDAAMRHPRRNEIYRDVGSEEHTPDDPGFVELSRVEFEPDSALVLCSDGLTDQVTSREILRIVQEEAGAPAAAVEELIRVANRAGGKDNVSVVIVEGPLFRKPLSSGHVSRQEGKHLAPLLKSRPAMALYGLIAGLLIMYWSSRPVASPDASLAPPSQVLVVDTSGAAQFRSIGEALAQARPGDTIELSAGEYRERVRLKGGVSIFSRVPYSAIIRPPENDRREPAVIAEQVKTGRVSGVRILGDDKAPLAAGILLVDSDIELIDSEITGAKVGLDIRGRSNPLIRANSIHDCVDSGVTISGESAPWLSHNDIARNGRAQRDRRPGVLVIDAARPILIGNIFSDNGAAAVNIPAAMDGSAILKFNFFPKGEPLGRTKPGDIGGVASEGR